MENLHVRPKLKLSLTIDDKEVVDEEVASLLYMIDKLGSIIRASKYLGIPYSRAWEKLTRCERLLGRKVVHARKGGARKGGAELTEVGRLILHTYITYYNRLTGRNFQPIRAEPPSEQRERGVFAGSHDILVSNLIGVLRHRGLDIDAYWLGSIGGLNSVLYGEADIAGLHLLDEETGEYNIPYYRALNLSSVAVLVRGYERAIGFVSRRKMSVDEILEGLLSGELRIVNRQAGSGSRKLLDSLLSRKAVELGIGSLEYSGLVRGYDYVVPTHFHVAEAVARGEADVGLAIQHVAGLYGLEFSLVGYERYDFVVRRDFMKRHGDLFLNALKEFVKSSLSKFSGYRVDDSLGLVVEG